MTQRLSNDTGNLSRPHARLLAIVAVSPSRKVACQNPGCGHGVYAAIHVVEENGQLLVMGSTCYAKRYGGAQALGVPAYSAGGGNGKLLTEAEREALVNNTQSLLDAFKAEHDRVMTQAEARLRESVQRIAQRTAQRQPFRVAPAAPRPAPPNHPWPWQHHLNQSVAVTRSPDGQAWIRVQHSDGGQRLVPWPVFEGWEESLPAYCGTPDLQLQVLTVPNIVVALQGLQRMGFTQPQVSRWPEVFKLASPTPTPTAA